MTRAKGDVRAGSGATKNTRNFVFSVVDKVDNGVAAGVNDKADAEDDAQNAAAAKRKRRIAAASAAASKAKRPKVDRRLDENSAANSIFGLM